MPNNEVIFKGELKRTKDGFHYIDVPDSIIDGFLKMVESDVKKPPYFTSAFNNVGAHISVFSSDEIEDRNISEVGQEFEYTLAGTKHLKPEGWDKMKQVYFLIIKSPELEKLRRKYKLPGKLHGHDFHITIAVQPTESVHRLTALYEETPEGLGLKTVLRRKGKGQTAIDKALGRKVGSATKTKQFNSKAKLRSPSSKSGQQALGAPLSSIAGGGGMGVAKNPRHRRFMGMQGPGRP